jgi:ATP-binding cassette subfamily B protein
VNDKMSHEEDVLGKAYDGRLMRRLLTYLRPYRPQVALAIAAIIGHSILELAPPFLTKLVIDRYIPARDGAGLVTVAVVFFLTLAGSFALEYLQTWTMQMTGQRIMFDLRMQLYEHLQRLDLKFYDRNPVGRLMTRVTTDVDVLNELFTSGVVSVFGDAFTLIGIMGVLVWMDWRLALVAFSVLPLIAMITQWFRSHVRESYRTVRTWIARINAYLQERITGMATVQLFGGRHATSRLRRDRSQPPRRERRVDLLLRGLLSRVEFVSALRLAHHLGRRRLGRWRHADAGSLVAFLQYSQRFFRPISDMSEKFNVLQGAMASSERIFALLDTPLRSRPLGRPHDRAEAGGPLPRQSSGRRAPAGQGPSPSRTSPSNMCQVSLY